MNPMMAGVAGAAVGAAGGAWIAHEMTEDSQGNAVASTTYAAPAGAAPGMYGGPGGVPPPPPKPIPTSLAVIVSRLERLQMMFVMHSRITMRL